jgi:hypothetical protein
LIVEVEELERCASENVDVGEDDSKSENARGGSRTAREEEAIIGDCAAECDEKPFFGE